MKNEKPKLEKMQIKVTRMLNKNGDEMYYIDSIEGIATREELPNEYLDGDCAYLSEFPGKRVGIYLSPRGKSIVVGTKMTRVDFEKSLMFINACGTRLTAINAKIEEKRKKWMGSETYEI